MNNWFAEKLIIWYQANKRDLPWRLEKDPYKIWLSEIILQQTQVKQGLAYYHRFSHKFPDVKKLALASENEVMKMWEGLGYYSRARNLHATAKIIVNDYKGKFPSEYQQILQLKGIGTYTAAAISSFAFDLPYAVVDGNVYRLLSRVFAIDTPVDTGQGKKIFQELANTLLPVKNAATYNQAIMEFGAQYCKPFKPDCEQCVFTHKCLAFKGAMVEVLPAKSKKTKTKSRHFNYLIFIDAKSKVSVKKRTEKDIWQGLYEFPKVESQMPIGVDELLKTAKKSFKLNGLKKALVFSSQQYKHLLTHRTIYAKFYIFKPISIHIPATQKTQLKKLEEHAFPQLIVKFIRDCLLKEKV